MRLVLTAMTAIAVAGCASTAVSPAISDMSNVEITTGDHGHQYVDRVAYLFTGTRAQGDNLPLCVAQNIQNRSITLRDSTGSQFIPFYGVVTTEVSREVGGGQAIRYISDDKNSVLTTGTVEHSTKFMGINNKQSVRFDLALKINSDGLSAVFTNIEKAQIDTGSASNDGYRKLGAWSNAQPEESIAQLKKLADNINQCLMEL